jgi:hypothetical protein
VTDHRIDESGDEEGVREIGNELHPFRDRARYDGGHRAREHRLEEPECFQRQAVNRRGRSGEEPPLGSDDQTLGSVHDCEAEGEETEGCETEIESVLHQHVGSVLGPDEPGLDHSEARLHQKDHERREQNPERAHSVEAGFLCRRRGFLRKCAPADQRHDHQHQHHSSFHEFPRLWCVAAPPSTGRPRIECSSLQPNARCYPNGYSFSN